MTEGGSMTEGGGSMTRSSSEAGGGKVACILLVDDNEADNFLHKKAIEKAGCAEEVLAYENPVLALRALEDETIRPDVVFLDINMPQMTGWDFADRYRALPPEKRHARLVMMLTTSVNPDDQDRAESMSAVNGFCAKPLTPERARQVVDDALRDGPA